MPALNECRRLVVKIGTSIIGDARGEWLGALAEDIAALRAKGTQVVVVSSGAVALGREALGYGGRVLKLEEKQAAHACGQWQLMERYATAFALHKIAVAQVLLTPDDTENRRRYLNARTTFETLLAAGALPVVNENDTVATAELRFGDNDRLAARVAQMVSADALVILSDIDGLYTANPAADPNARHIPTVEAITPEIERMAGGAASAMSSGGMVTKIEAARIATRAGCHTAIAPGKDAHPLRTLKEGGRCTWFLASETPGSARKHWIAGSLQPMGALTVDDGALRALGEGKSLLPAGVTVVEGAFERGDPVVVRDISGREIARGLVAYGADDARHIIGRKSHDIEAILGYKGRSELIHRDDLVLTRRDT